MKDRTDNRRILFISSRLPYPPIGGDRLKNYWLLKILAKHFDVHLVSIAEEKVNNDFYKWAEELGITYKIFPKEKHEFLISAIKSLISKYPIQVNYYYFKDVQEYIDKIYKNYDLLFATLIRTARYIMDKEKPKILDMADSIGLNYMRALRKTKSFKWKVIYTFETKRLLKFEENCIKLFDKVLFFNKDEMGYYNMPSKCVWMPHGVNESLLVFDKINPQYRNYICFFGKMNYQPNIDAVMWFVENVLPLINKNLKFCIIGAYPTKEIKGLEKKYKNIVVTGFLDDPYEILKSSLCVVAPMQTGGGIQNKILECMALGTINIVSSLAAKPIGGIHGEHFLVIDRPEEIAQTINDIYANPHKYEHIKINSREFIKNNFTWTIYENKLMKIIQEVLR